MKIKLRNERFLIALVTAGIGIGKFAKKTHVSIVTLERYLHKGKYVSPATASKILKSLGTSFDDLFVVVESDDPTKNS